MKFATILSVDGIMEVVDIAGQTALLNYFQTMFATLNVNTQNASTTTMLVAIVREDASSQICTIQFVILNAILKTVFMI